jgi:hypothetical protein
MFFFFSMWSRLFFVVVADSYVSNTKATSETWKAHEDCFL